MGPAAALEIPWYPFKKKKKSKEVKKKKNTEHSASVLHAGTVCLNNSSKPII